MKKLLLNTCGEILTRENYEKVKDFNPKELQKLVGLYHRFIKECNGDKDLAKRYLNTYVKYGYVNRIYSRTINVLNKKVEIYKEAIKRLNRMIDYYRTLI